MAKPKVKLDTKNPDWRAYRKEALAYRILHGTLKGFPYFEYANDKWYLDPKGKGNFSPKSLTAKFLEVADKRAETLNKTFTLEDYLDYAKRNGYSEADARSHYKTLRKRLQAPKRFINQLIHDDHINAISLDDHDAAGWEHWRNHVLLPAALNLEKSNKRIPLEIQRLLGTKNTKEELIAADFANEARVSGKFVREIYGVLSGTKWPKTVTPDLLKNLTKLGIKGGGGGLRREAELAAMQWMFEKGNNPELKAFMDENIPKVLPQSTPGAGTPENLSPELLRGQQARERGSMIKGLPEFGISEYMGLNTVERNKKKKVVDEKLRINKEDIEQEDTTGV